MADFVTVYGGTLGEERDGNGGLSLVAARKKWDMGLKSCNGRLAKLR